MNEKDEIEFIQEPLLTEEGFVNEACLNALSAAINNMPKTYERLAGEPEWSEERWTFKDEITGSLAKWAIRQSPHDCPAGLEKVIGYLDACLSRVFSFDIAGMCKLSLIQINKALYDILYEQGISDFDKWNEGEGFIDLDALLRNVCIDIRMERREKDKFDKEFEKKYPQT